METHQKDAFFNSQPIIMPDGKLFILGQNNCIFYDLDNNTSLAKLSEGTDNCDPDIYNCWI